MIYSCVHFVQEFHAYITLGGKPPECGYPLKGIGFLPCGWGESDSCDEPGYAVGTVLLPA
jgi:hypothetical protein